MRYLILSLAALTLTACSSMNVDDVLPDKAVEYKRETQAERNLEIPPDLTSDRINDKMSVPDNFGGVSTSYSEYVTDRRLRGADGSSAVLAGGGVLPDIDNLEIRRDGEERWLWINAPVEEVWQRVTDFWLDSGILLIEQDPTVGIMRTSWLENRAQIRDDFVTNTIRRAFDALYETGTRDQYRVRLERGSNGSTELYLTHFGMKEQVMADSSGKVENTVWQPRERDPQLEAEMLRRIMVFLGAADERARAQLAARGQREVARSELINTQRGVELRIAENFSRAWRLIGLALDRVGFAVEDRDRSAGVYYVRYNDPSRENAEQGWLSSLAFWSDDDVDKVNRYQVRVTSQPGMTVVGVANEAGEPDRSPTALRILTLLQEQVR
jgi:outer membrane protein assembly factor BamC